MKTQHVLTLKACLRVACAFLAGLAVFASAGTISLFNPQHAQAAVSALSCATGDFYSVDDSGVVYKATASGNGINSELATVGITFPDTSNTSVNGLAIGSNGSTVFSFTRANQGDNVTLNKWSASTNAITTKVLNPLSIPSQFSFETSSLIAGGVNPKDPTGYYYFGGYSQLNSQTVFLLWKANPDTLETSFVGYIVMPTVPSGTRNGDLSFDQNGDMYLLLSTGGGNTNMIVSVTAAVLAASNASSIPRSAPVTIDASGIVYNGMALSNDGKVYVQGQITVQGATVTEIGMADPQSSGAATSMTPVTSQGRNIAGVDLASCQTPPTIQSLKKNVVSRYNATDQFQLSITPAGSSTASATATTTGTASGIQSEVAGPIVVSPGSTYVLEEVGAGTPAADISKYVSTLSCIDTNNGNAAVTVTPVSGSSTKYTITIPTGTIAAISCTFTNTAVQKLWNFFLQKYGPNAATTGTQTALDGAAFQILADSGNQPGAVLPAYNPAAVSGQTGKFSVGNIPEGTYWLKESNSPAGYNGLASPVQFKVGADGSISLTGSSTQVAVVKDQTGKIFTINVSDPQKPGVVLPNTGGEGTQMYLVVGLLVLIGGFGAVLFTKRMTIAR
ncbi:SpaA isopeptide-forming pilin-related protein [Bifidobacterium aquikefiri]|uniref:SpaA isopeptide-forming pilin-related protein n=1 Tax=Bifidobacterium aquikefiri TaxID=1653207 RepID=UPI0039E975B5